MFLSEGYVSNNEEQIGADPIYAMQIMQEATDDWNDICMKMIKLEHTAIMREDAELLAEGAKEALTRFKNNIVVLGRKLIEYLERVRVQWSKLQASIASKFVNTTAVQALISKFREGEAGKGYQVMIPSNWDSIRGVVENFSKLTGEIRNVVITNLGKAANRDRSVDSKVAVSQFGGTNKGKSYKGLADADEDIDEKIQRLFSQYSYDDFKEETETPLTQAMIQQALDFLKKRPVAIKNIETMKKVVTEVQNACIKEMDKTDRPQNRNSLVVLQRQFNRLIIKINKSTSLAVKICNAVNGSRKDTGITGKQKSQAYDDARKAKGVFVRRESVLDLF